MSNATGVRRAAIGAGTQLTRLSNWSLGEPAAASSSVLERILIVVVFVGGTALAFSRLTAATAGTLWAEDGAVFMTHAYAHPWIADVLFPYNGYAHAYPRTIASIIAALVNLRDVPVAVAVAACATTGAVAAVVFWALRSRIPQWPIRLVLALMIVAMPLASIEINGSIANAHWYLMVGLFAVLISRQRSLAGRIVAAIVIFAAVLSDPLTLLFSPLAVLRFFDRGERSRWIVPGAYVVAAITQVAIVKSTTLAAAHPFSIGGLLRSLAFRVYLEGLTGHAVASALFNHGAYLALVAATLAILAIAVIAAMTRVGGFVIVSFITATGFFLVAVAVRWTGDLDPVGGVTDSGTRYQFVPICILLMAIACLFSTLIRSDRRAWQRVGVVIAGLVVVSFTVSAAVDWRLTDRVGPWSLSSAMQTCSSADAPKQIAIQGSPYGFPLVIDCSIVRDQLTGG